MKFLTEKSKVPEKKMLDKLFQKNNFDSIIDFQKKNNLLPDGIFGELSFKKLKSIIENKYSTLEEINCLKKIYRYIFNLK